MAAKPGDVVSGRSSSLDRLGHALATADGTAESARIADAFLARMQVTYSDSRGEVSWRNRAAS
jgi:hypothetical protein